MLHSEILLFHFNLDDRLFFFREFLNMQGSIALLLLSFSSAWSLSLSKRGMLGNLCSLVCFVSPFRLHDDQRCQGIRFAISVFNKPNITNLAFFESV